MILEINEQVVDLPANTTGLIRLNKSVAALSNLETRSGEFSWQFTLPPTRRNAGIFGQVLHAQTLDKYAVQTYPFRLRAGGEEWRGTFRLTGLKSGYSGTLVTESLDWAVGLSEKMLTDLTTMAPVSYDGSQLESILQKGCEETDVQFPLVAYGNFFAPPTLDEEGEEVPASAEARISYPLAVDDAPPAVFVVSLIRAILREQGLYAAGRVFSDLGVRRWCITAAGSKGDFWPWGALLPASATANTQQQQHSYFETSNQYGDDFYNTAAGFDAANDVMYFMPKAPVVLVPGGTRALTPGKPEFIAPVEGTYTFTWGYNLLGASQFIDEENNSGVTYWPGFAPVAVGLVAFRGGEGYEGADGGLCTSGTGQFDADQTRVLVHRRLDQPGTFGNLQAGSFNGFPVEVYLAAGDLVRLLFFTRRVFSRVGDGLNKYTRKEFHFTTASVSLACTAFDGPLLLRPEKCLPDGMNMLQPIRDLMLRTDTLPIFDQANRTVHFLDRLDHSAAQGPPINLDSCVDPASLEYLPVLAGIARMVFQPAETEDEAAPAGTDVVTIRLQNAVPGDTDKAINSPYAATGKRYFSVDGRGSLHLLTAASKEELATPRSEAVQDFASKAPRIVVYDPPEIGGVQIPFQNRYITPGLASYLDTNLAWSGDTGVVAQHYQGLIEQSQRGHIAKCTAALSPDEYKKLSANRRVEVLGASYLLEKIENWDAGSAAGTCQLQLLRIV